MKQNLFSPPFIYYITSAFNSFLSWQKVKDPYVRRIRLLKTILPFTIVAVSLSLLFWPSLFGHQRYEALSSDPLNKKDNTLMTNPKYYGHDVDGKPYSLQASTVYDQGSKTYKLEKPSADWQAPDGWMMIRSTEGKFNQTDQKLDLRGGVTLYHNQGYELNIDHATVKLDEGRATAQTPVHGQTPNASIKAEGLELYDQGDKIIFIGESEITIRSQTKEDEKTP